jgi:hypothetical protein
MASGAAINVYVVSPFTTASEGRGQPLGPRSSGKKHYHPIFFNRFFAATLRTLCGCRCEPGFSFSKNRSLRELRARRGNPFSQPSGSSNILSRCLPCPTFEPKGADRNSPALLPPARFCWSTVSITTRVSLGKRARHQLFAHPEIIRSQKTFSAGPRSFSSKELWFTSSIPAGCVQPVSDSRHGRIADKASVSCTNCKFSREQPSPIS